MTISNRSTKFPKHVLKQAHTEPVVTSPFSPYCNVLLTAFRNSVAFIHENCREFPIGVHTVVDTNEYIVRMNPAGNYPEYRMVGKYIQSFIDARYIMRYAAEMHTQFASLQSAENFVKQLKLAVRKVMADHQVSR